MLCDHKWDETIELHIHAFIIRQEISRRCSMRLTTIATINFTPHCGPAACCLWRTHDHKEISSLVSNTTHLSQRVSHSWPRENCFRCHGICKIKCWTHIHLIIWCQNIPNEASLLLFSAAPSHCSGTNRERWRLALLHNGWCASSKEPWCSLWLSLAFSLHGLFYSQPARRISNPVLDRVIAAFLLVPDR